MKKISFLIAAHNEERIIGKTLKNLLNLPYKDYEVIIGLDGCTDKTESIVRDFVKRSRKFKYYNLNLRSGKPAVIDNIIKKASGEIIVINDADWIFKVDNEIKLKKFFSFFDNEKIGGIAEPFPVEWDKNKLKNSNLGYKIVAYGTYYWIKFQKKKFTYKKNDLLYLKEPTMFLTNIFRKEFYKKYFSLGDDFERTKDIFDKGYKIILLEDETMPRMISAYNNIKIKDLLKQKIRTAIARKQLNQSNIMRINLFNYYFPSILFIFSESWKRNLYAGFITTIWIIITALGELISKFKKVDTKKGWTLRAKR
ncbi:MAG: glycosyltransferase family 2 protein [Nanoarchaeota archaeon]